MAYEKHDWEVVQAFFESGLSLSEIVARDEVVIKDRSSISKKAKAENWIKGKIQPLVEKSIQLKQELTELNEQKSTLNSTEKEVHDTLVYEKSTWISYLNKAAIKNIQDSLKIPCNSQQDIRHRGAAIKDAKEVIVGKTPEVALQVNTQVGNTIASKEEFREIAKSLVIDV